jgi:hypothetical protein
MTLFQLRTRRDQGVVPPPGVLLDWFGGGGSTIQVRSNLISGLTPPPMAVDFRRFAAAVYCADRLAVRPATWTRSLVTIQA